MPVYEVRVQIAGTILALLSVALVLELVRRRRLSEWQSLAWLLAAAMIGGFAAHRRIQFILADFVGIYYPPVLILAAFVFGGLAILLLQSVAITRLDSRCRRLAQEVALLREKLEGRERAHRRDSQEGEGA
ncbi:MAG TPA: DUF2304 domain-containing protein [Thermoanaerobaculia bacterium]|nr:DUF2304 domain-containing protein [Thermoanaerobaculia bacterium]HQP88103.1 DUF2304 domain-containing protein [Thermoanaerobaculia bacterium]